MDYGASIGAWMSAWVMAPQNGYACSMQIISTFLSRTMGFIGLYADGEHRTFLSFFRSPLDIVP